MLPPLQGLRVTFTATMTVDYKRALFSGLMHNSDKEGFRFHSPLCLSFSTSSVGLFAALGFDNTTFRLDSEDWSLQENEA